MNAIVSQVRRFIPIVMQAHWEGGPKGDHFSNEGSQPGEKCLESLGQKL